jgi:hypothetical protein
MEFGCCTVTLSEIGVVDTPAMARFLTVTEAKSFPLRLLRNCILSMGFSFEQINATHDSLSSEGLLSAALCYCAFVVHLCFVRIVLTGTKS